MKLLILSLICVIVGLPVVWGLTRWARCLGKGQFWE